MSYKQLAIVLVTLCYSLLVAVMGFLSLGNHPRYGTWLALAILISHSVPAIIIQKRMGIY